MQTTTNYGMTKIDLTDSPPDITALNGNFDTIDLELKSHADAIPLKLDADIYTALDILNKLKTVDGAASGLDAQYIAGASLSTSNTLGGTIPSDTKIASQKAVKDYLDANMLTLRSLTTLSADADVISIDTGSYEYLKLILLLHSTSTTTAADLIIRANAETASDNRWWTSINGTETINTNAIVLPKAVSHASLTTGYAKSLVEMEFGAATASGKNFVGHSVAQHEASPYVKTCEFYAKHRYTSGSITNLVLTASAGGFRAGSNILLFGYNI